MASLFGLEIVCNGCSKAMEDCGEWPEPIALYEDGVMYKSHMYQCRTPTCRLPREGYPDGVDLFIHIVVK